LVVDADAVLTTAIPLEGLQSITAQDSEVGQSARRIEHAELLERCPGAALKAHASTGCIQALALTIAERLDQIRL